GVERTRLQTLGRMVMNYEKGFLEEIREHPDDPTPRLVYADWLEEQGGSDRLDKAEFIRVQIERERTEEDNPRYPDLAAREEALQKAHARLWLGQAAPWCRDAEFRGGLLYGLTLPAVTFLRHAAELFAVGPVQHVRLQEARDYLSNLADSP